MSSPHVSARQSMHDLLDLIESKAPYGQLQEIGTQLRAMLREEEETAGRLSVLGWLNHSGQPFLTMRWGDREAKFTIAEARRHALHVLEGIECSRVDSFFYLFMTEQVGLDRTAAVQMLNQLRLHRVALAERES